MKDIMALIQEIEKDQNNLCILMLDANESIQDKEGGLRKQMADTNLVDPFTYFMGDICNIATYARGKKRIDHILISNNLVP
jgi:hypothetical protein